MGKFFSSIKAHINSLITLFVILIVGAYYFFIYIPNNEKTVQERHFRCLQNIDKNIRDKIKGSVQVLATILNSINKQGDLPSVIIDNGYKKKYGTLPFVLLTGKESVRDSSVKPLGLDDIDYTTGIKVDAQSQQLSLYVTWREKIDTQKKKRPFLSEMGMRFQFNDFIKPLLPGEIFKGYIVFIKEKKIYESFSTGLNYPANAKDSLLTVSSRVTSPGVREFKIGGIGYKAFSQPLFNSTGEQWIITGLVTDESYQQEKNQLPVAAVELLLTVVITMLVILPWIKLYHMGNKDKLSITDGIASLLVSMIMMSLIFFVFFNYNPTIYSKTLSQPQIFPNSSSNRSIKKDTNDKKPIASYSRDEYSRNIIASRIIAAFENEIDSAYLLLKALDKIKPDTNAPVHIKSNMRYYSVFKKNEHNIQASQMAWLDNDGNVVRFLTNDLPQDVDIPMNTKLNDRAYFRNVKAKHFNKTTPYQFYIDQIISRSSNSFESVIATQSDTSDEVAIMSFSTHSLEDVVMPDGFSFAIIDGNGNVLYHSIPDRNLNENLKDELADSSDLVSCLEARSDTSFSGKYYGKLYNIKIKPFVDMPYFAVILENKEYIDARNTQPYVFTLCMLICLLVYLILQFAVIFFASAKQSFFKKQWYDISWVGPKEKSHQQYNLAIICNTAVIILLIFFFSPDHFLRYTYILLLSITFVSIFLNAIFAKSYRKTSPYLYRFKEHAIFWLCIFILLIDVASWETLNHWEWWSVFIYEGCITIVGTLLYLFGRKLLVIINRKLGDLKRRWTFTQSFALMTVTRLIITSGIPVAFFFVCSFNYEVRLDTRYRQNKFGKALIQKPAFLSDVLSARADTSQITKTNDKNRAALDHERRIKKIDSITNGWGVYSDLLYVNTITDAVRKTDTMSEALRRNYAITDKNENLVTRTILSAFRFHVNDIEIKNSNMNLTNGGDSIHYNPIEPGNKSVKNVSNRHLSSTFLKLDSSISLKLSSGNITYSYPDWWWWLLLIIVLFIFYIFIHRIIRKIFALDLPSTAQWDKIDDDLVANNQLNNLLFIVGSPGSRKLHKLKDKIRNGTLRGYNNTILKLAAAGSKGNVHIADMILIPSDPDKDDQPWGQCKLNALNKDSALVIINHFEYNIKDPVTNRAKLNFLESLMYQDSAKIVIISTVHPVSFLDSFSDLDNNDGKSSIPQNELERWHVLLGHFRIVIEPLTERGGPKITKKLSDVIKAETRYSFFMNKMRGITLRHTPRIYREDQIGTYSDSLIFKLQLTSQYFYTYIWQSLTKEEKLLLYDLAEDGLVNSYDSHNLSLLMAKGLIIKDDGTLMLFNKGFRNFILTAIGTTEAKRIKDQVKDTGNWGTLRTPLNLVILAILFFLILSQQESYSRIITYITTVGAGFSAIIRLFPALGASDTQKTP
jgi:hypothetical protein